MKYTITQQDSDFIVANAKGIIIAYCDTREQAEDVRSAQMRDEERAAVESAYNDEQESKALRAQFVAEFKSAPVIEVKEQVRTTRYVDLNGKQYTVKQYSDGVNIHGEYLQGWTEIGVEWEVPSVADRYSVFPTMIHKSASVSPYGRLGKKILAALAA